MKKFKTFEELMDYVSNKENLEFLESGEVLLKEWNEDAKVLRQYQKRYGQATSDQKVWDSQQRERICDRTFPEYELATAYSIPDDCETCGVGNDPSSLRQHANEPKQRGTQAMGTDA